MYRSNPESQVRDPRRKTILDLQKLKSQGLPISMVTAYDASQSYIADEAGLDAVLVGDSLAMAVLWHDSTLQVSMKEMLHHAKAVARGNSHSFLIGDMPFLSYHTDTAEAVRNAGAFLAEAGMQMVKLEGGREYLPQIQAITRAGIPVCGHLGLLPQQVNRLGAYKRQGKDVSSARRIIEDAKLLQDEGGISLLVLEAVASQVAEYIAKVLEIPVIGIGCGAACDGQVLVFHDLLGLNPGKKPSFARSYLQGAELMKTALEAYTADVKNRAFPDLTESFSMEEELWEGLKKDL